MSESEPLPRGPILEAVIKGVTHDAEETGTDPRGDCQGSDAESPSPEPKSEPLPGLGGASPIQKPSAFSLDKFKSKRPTARPASVPCWAPCRITLSPKRRISSGYTRMRPIGRPSCASSLCRSSGRRRCSLDPPDRRGSRDQVSAGREDHPACLALASKPYDVLFLGHVPTTNLDNSWNESNLAVASRRGALGAIDESEGPGAEATRSRSRIRRRSPSPNGPRRRWRRSSARRSVRPCNRAGRPTPACCGCSGRNIL